MTGNLFLEQVLPAYRQGKIIGDDRHEHKFKNDRHYMRNIGDIWQETDYPFEGKRTILQDWYVKEGIKCTCYDLGFIPIEYRREFKKENESCPVHGEKEPIQEKCLHYSQCTKGNYTYCSDCGKKLFRNVIPLSQDEIDFLHDFIENSKNLQLNIPKEPIQKLPEDVRAFFNPT